MSWKLILAYTLFSFFSFMQTRHFQRFRGESEGVKAALGLFGFGAMIFQAGYLIYLGFTIHWYTPILLFITGFFFSTVLSVVTVVIPDFILSLLGFIVVPTAAYFMVAGVR